MYKVCTKCGKHKPLWSFSKHKGCKFGVRNNCKTCMNKSNKKYNKNNKEKSVIRHKKYYEVNKERLLIQHRKYNQDNKITISLIGKIYRESNKKAKSEYDKNYKMANKDKILLRNKKYRENNKAKVNNYCANYRALKLKATPVLTKQELKDIELYYILAQYLSEFGTKHHVDHIIPLSKGGLHHPDNLQVLTERDNRCKNAKLNYKCKDEVYKL